MRSLRSQFAVTAVATILGFLLVLQFRAQGAAPGLAALSAQDLTTLIANLNTRNEQLAAEVARLDVRLRDLQAGGTQSQVSLAAIREDLDRVRRWAGLVPGVGRGVVVSVAGSVSADAVNDLLNELRASGAEAIAIEDVRILDGDVVASLPGGLAVRNAALADRFSISAVGDPAALTASLTRVGGIIGRIQVAEPEVSITVVAADRVEMPATTRPLRPAYGKPRV